MNQTKLTEHQLALLTRAAAAEDGFADAFEGEAKAVAGLIRRGMVMRASSPSEPDRIMVTSAGRALLVPADKPPETRTRRSKRATLVSAATLLPEAVTPPPPRGKLGLVADLLRRPKGATLAQLMNATGWQAHSVRGAMSTMKKKQNLAIISDKTHVGRVYWISEGHAA